ncbi:MAG: 7-cyano-7-deazaguanine synthase, partial [Acidobacteria bacterium]|nr:7-cyano-7-deazaguanine synthase [Acidobacteriota bacterium]
MAERREKAVVLVSGGMDSCVTAAIAAQDHALAFFHASYGQRTERRERKAFDDVADFYGVKERLTARLDHFRQIGASSLTDESIPVPEADLSRRQIPSSYVPFRNAHFLAAGVSWAEAIGAGKVFIGAVWEDSSGYPDCRPEYYRVFNELVRAGT